MTTFLIGKCLSLVAADLNLMRSQTSKTKSGARNNLCLVWIPGSRGTIATVLNCKLRSLSAIISSFSFAYVRYFAKLFHKEGFTYDYVFDWNMLKSGGSDPESDENLAKHQRQKSEARICFCFVWIPGSRGTIASSDLKQPEWWKWSRTKAVHPFNILRKMFHRQGFTYDYIVNWKMLKFGGSRPETKGDLDKDQEQKH